MAKFESRAQLAEANNKGGNKKKGGVLKNIKKAINSLKEPKKESKFVTMGRDSLVIAKSRGGNTEVSEDFNDKAYYDSHRDRQAAINER
mmetsp:Transcript_11373/g.22527  ORF Transcript_11373/g.22527 Transcript_11373/m.22527 type:complete len:89 (-) Transcript_11373:150-416(-)|eukprot:CAMPEP_0194328460 /NCGR_PEP_ID=MMETSP0171-20130528/44913_1 /TAXON_ID=218684 /ORGANISM="Corethron pennatum, Strain L29A3" /LENGTH=88 /DNA_ID=CAMNT_0039088823 /DNA_START=141 /DNA_END=407 /DNA_ORIENTATION=+